MTEASSESSPTAQVGSNTSSVPHSVHAAAGSHGDSGSSIEPDGVSTTMNERGPDGPRSFGSVEHRLQIPLEHAMVTQRAVRRVSFDPVDDDIIVRLIELGLNAPTGSNGQNWEFIVVKDRDAKAAMAKHYRQSWKWYRRVAGFVARRDPKQQKILKAVQWQVDNFEHIPVIIVPCLRGGPRVPFVPTPPFAQSSHYGSIYPSVQNILLAARALGLGASLVTLPIWSSMKTRKLLGLPRSVQPVCAVPLGWPRGRYGPVSRRPVGDVVHLDLYGVQAWKTTRDRRNPH